MRLDRARFDTGRFEVTIAVPTRFADLDTQGHVNNAAAIVLLQEARAAFNRTAGLTGAQGALRMMVAALTVEFAGEMFSPGVVTVSNGVLALGRTSFTVAQLARQDGRVTTYAQTVMVMTDEQGAAPLPEIFRSTYARYLID